ncbi:MAG: hypothetical protein A3B11_01870 [Candidatus Taylorbacteria bacterium RIFCSPLOWO2_01_FULL_44_26]|uniref:Uncharacterized protein n=2 Tax=Candidatus Tayloriibacteriota TaxID=1817919 RepID=A0A1G2MJP7_9BACT|nr:MAG: hypothetical protein A3D50_02020 [Candidatus Taylorbacteria bacterium RIFCSPHIGHO2_02_FULL_44_12]OHA31421.1 MAG: hypothetical protein A3B11_01870 [Candidatus Taylorbacteria bacterium RIFCSPLOWO2_01_FULL_44_26]
MLSDFPQKNRGLVRTVVLIVIALLILSYFGFNLRAIATSPTSKANFAFATEIINAVWNTYLQEPIMYLWSAFKKLIWDQSLQILEDGAQENATSTR